MNGVATAGSAPNRCLHVVISVCVLASLLMGWTPARALAVDWTITFDEIAPPVTQGQVIDDEYTLAGDHPLIPGMLGAEFRATEPDGTTPKIANIFDSTEKSGNDDDLVAPFDEGVDNTTGEGSKSPGNILIMQDEDHEGVCDITSCSDPNDEGNRPAGRFFVEFTDFVYIESIDFFDIDDEEEDDAQPANEIRFYGDVVADPLNLLHADGAFHTPLTGNHRWDRLDFGIAGVRLIEIRLGGSGAIDNFVGRLETRVPEPGTLGLMALSAFGLALVRPGRRRACPRSVIAQNV